MGLAPSEPCNAGDAGRGWSRRGSWGWFGMPTGRSPVSKTDNPLLVSRDLLVTCRNSQGAPVRAVPVRLSRYTALLEVYNPHSILQLSEVLGSSGSTWGSAASTPGAAW